MQAKNKGFINRYKVSLAIIAVGLLLMITAPSQAGHSDEDLGQMIFGFFVGAFGVLLLLLQAITNKIKH